MCKTEDIETKIDKLPDHVKPELNDFIDFLLSKYGEKRKDHLSFTFDWEGKLTGLSESAVELQHKALKWR